MRSVILILNLFVNCGFVVCILIETPQNVAVYAGQRMSFRCEMSNGSTVREWLFNRSSDSSYQKLVNTWTVSGQPTVQSPYGIDVDESGSGELFLNDTRMNDAGKYSCLAEVNDKLTYYHAELIVLESEPVCNLTDLDSRRIRAECSVNFSGNRAPKMSWIYNRDTLYVNDMNTGTAVNKTRVRSTFDAVVVSSAFALSCKTYFEHQNSTNLSSDSASNVPHLVYVWYAAKGEQDSSGSPKTESRLPSRSVVTTPSSEESGNVQYATFMYIVVALALALVLSMTATLVCVCRRRKRNATLAAVGGEETKAKGRIYSGVYDTIEYDDIGYEMPDHPASSDEQYRGYDLPVKDRVPSGYEDLDKDLNAKDTEPTVLSSQYITTMADSVKENGAEIIVSSDNKGRRNDNNYTSLSNNDARKQEAEKNSSVEKERLSYLEVIDDEDKMKITDESTKVSLKSSSSEGSQERNKAPSANANYTQLMPESGYTHLVL